MLMFPQVVLGLVRFGFVGTYLSEPVVRAYTSAAAGHAVVAQLKNIFGVSPKRFSGPLSFVYVSPVSCVEHVLLESLVCFKGKCVIIGFLAAALCIPRL